MKQILPPLNLKSKLASSRNCRLQTISEQGTAKGQIYKIRLEAALLSDAVPRHRDTGVGVCVCHVLCHSAGTYLMGICCY